MAAASPRAAFCQDNNPCLGEKYHYLKICTCSADVLSDPDSRKQYDLCGLDGPSQSGAASGRSNAREAWDEFKPFKKENKRTRARDAVRTNSGSQAASQSKASASGSESELEAVSDIR